MQATPDLIALAQLNEAGMNHGAGADGLISDTARKMNVGGIQWTQGLFRVFSPWVRTQQSAHLIV